MGSHQFRSERLETYVELLQGRDEAVFGHAHPTVKNSMSYTSGCVVFCVGRMKLIDR